MKWTREKLEALYVEVQKKAMTDEAFRKELLADSTKAIEALAGEKLPEGFRLKVIENDPAYTATMVLPDLVGRELTDEEVEAAAGGGLPFYYFVTGPRDPLGFDDMLKW